MNDPAFLEQQALPHPRQEAEARRAHDAQPLASSHGRVIDAWCSGNVPMGTASWATPSVDDAVRLARTRTHMRVGV
eukprot:322580-Alexandrium_andersonii.AAC.1